MNMLMKKVSLSLVLSATALVAYANPAHSRGERDVVGVVRQQQDLAEKNEPQTGRNYQSPELDRGSEESFKKNSRLTPEERRTLRRQINEAGQDLYVRKP